MSNEARKDFNAMLNARRDMPKIQIITDPKAIAAYGGDRMYFVPPIDYDRAMRRVPFGKLLTVGDIRSYLARRSGADFTEPLTAGLFVSIAAWASHQRAEDKIPYWRTLKTGGELNEKYPGGVEAQKALLEAEGHTVLSRGRKHLRYYVQDYEKGPVFAGGVRFPFDKRPTIRYNVLRKQAGQPRGRGERPVCEESPGSAGQG